MATKKNSEEFDEVAYKNDFSRKNYDHILLALPKGYKDTIKIKANELGVSVTSYIRSLIDEDLKL